MQFSLREMRFDADECYFRPRNAGQAETGESRRNPAQPGATLGECGRIALEAAAMRLKNPRAERIVWTAA